MVSIMGISYVFLNIQTTAFIISTIKQHNQISNKTSCQMFQLQLRMLTAPLKALFSLRLHQFQKLQRLLNCLNCQFLTVCQRHQPMYSIRLKFGFLRVPVQDDWDNNSSKFENPNCWNNRLSSCTYRCIQNKFSLCISFHWAWGYIAFHGSLPGRLDFGKWFVHHHSRCQSQSAGLISGVVEPIAFHLLLRLWLGRDNWQFAVLMMIKKMKTLKF